MLIVTGCIGLFFIYLTYQNAKQINIVEKDNNSLISKIKSLDENIVLFSELKELFTKTQELIEKNNKFKNIKNINNSIHSTNSHMDF